jgi:hypothetical protein
LCREEVQVGLPEVRGVQGLRNGTR